MTSLKSEIKIGKRTKIKLFNIEDVKKLQGFDKYVERMKYFFILQNKRENDRKFARREYVRIRRVLENKDRSPALHSLYKLRSKQRKMLLQDYFYPRKVRRLCVWLDSGVKFAEGSLYKRQVERDIVQDEELRRQKRRQKYWGSVEENRDKARLYYQLHKDRLLKLSQERKARQKSLEKLKTIKESEVAGVSWK